MNKSGTSLLNLVQNLTRVVNWRGEMVGTVASFAAISLIRLASSVILTRLLFPEAYGIVAMITAVAYVIELVTDVGIVALLIRHHRGAEPAFLHTVWTVRLARAAFNSATMFLLAPLIASWYATPMLEAALRIFAFSFVIQALESMSFLVAMRHQRSRIVSFAEVGSTLVATLFTVTFSYFSRDFHGMVFGMLVHRLTMVLISYSRSDRIWPKLTWEIAAVREITGFARYVGPSSFITVLVSQYDKFLVLKLFDLKLMGLYGVAGGVAGPVSNLIGRINHNVLYPRCAQYLREDVDTACSRFYMENIKLFALILFTPAAIAGLAAPIVMLLFDGRYVGATVVVQALCLASILSAFVSPSENLLVASGQPKMVLIGSILRMCWIVPASYIGYKLWGFAGFVFGTSLSSLPVIFYYWYRRHVEKLLIFRYEVYMIIFAAATWAIFWIFSFVYREYLFRNSLP